MSPLMCTIPQVRPPADARTRVGAAERPDMEPVMDPHRLTILPRAVSLVLLPLLAAFCTPASARVITVGPQSEATTVDAALARAEVGDEIVLQRGVEFPTGGLTVSIDAIEIRSADGPGAPATLRNTSTSKSATTVEHRGEGLTLRDLVMTGGDTVTCVQAKGRRLTLDNVTPTASIWRFVHLDGAQQTVIRNCNVPLLNDYNVCAFGGEVRGLLIERCTFGGSVDEHCIRLQRIHDARLRDSTFHMGGRKSALTIREGADVRVDNCTINGPIAIGPLADGDGGIKLPTGTPAERARREAMLRRTGMNYTLKNCTIDTNGITVEMGVQQLTFDGCWIKTNRQWVLRLNKDEYEPWRNIPTGQLVHCEVTGPAGLRPLENKRPDFHVIGTIVNGVRVPDTGVPTTQPSGPGGAVPGEVPATKPSTKPATQPTTPPATQPGAEVGARREDVVAALDLVEDAITQLHVARERLRSATQPSAVASAP